MLPTGNIRGRSRTSMTGSAPRENTDGPIAAQGFRCHLLQRPGSAGGHHTWNVFHKSLGVDRRCDGPLYEEETEGSPQTLARPATVPGQGDGSCRVPNSLTLTNSQEQSKCYISKSKQQEKSTMADVLGGCSSCNGSYLLASSRAILHLYLPKLPVDEEAPQGECIEETRESSIWLSSTPVTTSPPFQMDFKHFGSLGLKALPADRSWMGTQCPKPASHSGRRQVSLSRSKPTVALRGVLAPQCLLEEGHEQRRKVEQLSYRMVDRFHQRAVHTEPTERHVWKTIKTLEWTNHGPEETTTLLPLQTPRSRFRVSVPLPGALPLPASRSVPGPQS